MKQALIIPGYWQGPWSLSMRRTAYMFERQGINASIMRIHWSGKTFSEWLEEADRYVKTMHLGDVQLMGFSYGGMIAAMLASRQTPGRLLLCSMADYWAEDLVVRETAWWERMMDQRRLKDFSAYRFDAISSLITCPTTIFVGEREAQAAPSLLRRAVEAHQQIKQSALHVIPEAGHSLLDPNYYNAVRVSLI